MRTTLDCYPCFVRQALYTARLANASEDSQLKIMHDAFELFRRFDMTKSPPENAVSLYEMLAGFSDSGDPFHALKKESNRLAGQLAFRARRLIDSSPDPLLAALKFAIAGNVIDYGAQHDFNIEEALENCLAQEPVINDYDMLKKAIEKAENILYLGDNCGEIVFDRLVCETLQDKRITFAVKERPIINDATMSDALFCGLDQYSTVISNGTGCPGTPLDHCSDVFQESFKSADLIISKGQGNFETLSETRGPVYFLLTVKCKVVCSHIRECAGMPELSLKVGDSILLRSR